MLRVKLILRQLTSTRLQFDEKMCRDVYDLSGRREKKKIIASKFGGCLREVQLVTSITFVNHYKISIFVC